MACKVKRLTETKLCTGDLRHLTTIQNRSLSSAGLDSSQPVETFTTLRQQWCGIETVSKGVSRFAKINILDDTTHIFWCMYDSGLDTIENRNTFILHDSRLFKVLKIDNINERDETLAIQTTERGNTSEDASDA